MDFLGFLLTQCLNALSQASLLFFLGCGLTLIFGIMRIVNFAHGVIYMLGAYVGYSAVAIDRQLSGARCCWRRWWWAASARRSSSASCAACMAATATRS